MEAPVWKKMVDMEPGIYFFGGYREAPVHHGSLHTVENKKSYSKGCWMAFICEMPPTPVMPLPELQEGDRVLVRDAKECSWSRRHFASWSHAGKIQTWVYGSRWSGEGITSWNYWRLPTEEELNG